jgi:hypothetical protein
LAFKIGYAFGSRPAVQRRRPARPFSSISRDPGGSFRGSDQVIDQPVAVPDVASRKIRFVFDDLASVRDQSLLRFRDIVDGYFQHTAQGRAGLDVEIDVLAPERDHLWVWVSNIKSQLLDVERRRGASILCLNQNVGTKFVGHVVSVLSKISVSAPGSRIAYHRPPTSDLRIANSGREPRGREPRGSHGDEAITSNNGAITGQTHFPIHNRVCPLFVPSPDAASTDLDELYRLQAELKLNAALAASRRKAELAVMEDERRLALKAKMEAAAKQ